MIALTSYHSKLYEPLARYTLPGKREYCQRHGYEFHYVLDDGDEQTGLKGWDRIGIVLQFLLNGYETVMWADCDAMIMNHTVKIEDRFAPEDQFLISYDAYGINTGVFVCRNTQRMREFFHSILRVGRAKYENHVWGEQQAISDMLLCEPYDSLATKVPQKVMNSYINEESYPGMGRTEGSFSHGDWVLQFAGAELHRKIMLAAMYQDWVLK